jgi:hypothetical protein
LYGANCGQRGATGATVKNNTRAVRTSSVGKNFLPI